MKVALLGVLVLLAACATVPPNSREALALSDIVAETAAATRAPAAEQKRLLAQAEHRNIADPGDATTVRLAALLAVLPEPLGDDARAKALLDPIAEKAPGGPLTRFAALLSEQAAQRQRLRREHETARRAAQQREDALREQIEALKAIERGILEREERLRAKRR
jgi:hypothetical protein